MNLDSNIAELVSRFFPNAVLALNPLIHRCGGEIENIAGFQIAASEEQAFVKFVEWINSKPDFIVHWRSTKLSEDAKYLPFMNGIEESRNAFRAARYHLENLAAIELEISSVLSRYELSVAIPKGTVLALGQPRKWDYEYQAFVLQYRSSLEYFTIALAVFFDISTKQFPKFHSALEKLPNNPIAVAIEPIWRQAHAQFKFMREVRNRHIHESAVSAACINITANGFRYIGGGEEMGLLDRDDTRGLAERLEKRMLELHHFLSHCLNTLERAADALAG